LIGSELPIKLMLTDVILSDDLNGRQLAEQAARVRPGLCVLYMSGYTENILDGQHLDPGVELIEKPIQKDALAAKVRRILDEVPA
jgi:two-component SAPR family response regulator